MARRGESCSVTQVQRAEKEKSHAPPKRRSTSFHNENSMGEVPEEALAAEQYEFNCATASSHKENNVNATTMNVSSRFRRFGRFVASSTPEKEARIDGRTTIQDGQGISYIAFKQVEHFGLSMLPCGRCGRQRATPPPHRPPQSLHARRRLALNTPTTHAFARRRSSVVVSEALPRGGWSR